MRLCRVQRPGPRSYRNNLRGPGQRQRQRDCWYVSSESQLHAYLEPAWIVDGSRNRPVVVVAIAPPVERIEQVSRDRQACPARRREILPQPEVQVLVHGRLKATGPERIGWPAEPITQIVFQAAAQSQQARELDTMGKRHIHDPVGDEVVTFVVPQLPRIVDWIGEAEVIVEPLGFSLGEGVRESRPPPDAAGSARAIGTI